MSVCTVASTERYTSHACRSHMCQCAGRGRERERKKGKRESRGLLRVLSTWLASASARRRTAASNYPTAIPLGGWGAGGCAKDGCKEEESRYSNEEMLALKSRPVERGNVEGEVRGTSATCGEVKDRKVSHSESPLLGSAAI